MNKWMSNTSLDEFIIQEQERMDKDSFEHWWSEVEAFAEQNRLPTHYVEEEFIIDGELFPVHLEWQEDVSPE